MKRIYLLLAVLMHVNLLPMAMGQQTEHIMKVGIEELFKLIDENNTSLKVYRLAEAAAQEGVKTSRLGRLPSIDFSASASYLGDGRLWDRNFTNGMRAPIPSFGNNFALEVAQIVYAGGAVSAGVAMSELKLRTAKAEAELNKQNIRFLVVGNYLELYKLDNQAEVYRRNIEQVERLLSDIQARQQEGLALRNDVTRYELQLQRLKLALTQTLNSREIINDRMVTSLGLERDVLIEPDRNITDVLPAVFDEMQWHATAASAPSIQLATLGVAQSEQGIKLARAELMPKISLFAGDHLDGPITVEVPPLDKNLNYWYVGVGVNFSLSALYKSGHSVRHAKFMARQAEENRNLTAEHMHSDVREAYIRFNEAFTVCQMQEKNLELAKQNYEVVHNRFLNDLVLITDMLDADNEKLSAELDLVNARIGILFNYYRLKKVTGDL